MAINIQSEKFLKTMVGFIVIGLILLGATGCGKNDVYELYHQLPGKQWKRFNLLSFEIPVSKVDKPYDIYLFSRFTKEYPYDVLDFNMIMNTTDGEERINEYQMKVKSESGEFLFDCQKDSCEGIVLLKRELKLSKTGIITIEVENLTPRLVTEGIAGIGIRMVESRK